MIIIPAIDIIDGKCVRLTQGERDSQKVYDQDPVAIAHKWSQAGVSRIHVVDLDGAFEGGSRNLEMIARIAKEVETPIEVGGGIRTMEAVRTLIENGVSYVVIGTVVIENPQLASDIVEAYPGKIYIGIDARAGFVATHGWVKSSNRTALEITERAAEWKAHGIIFTAIERDGELVGPDFEAIDDLVSKSAIPVIASGGVTCMDDLRKLAAIPDLEGVIVGKALYEHQIDIHEAVRLESEEL